MPGITNLYHQEFHIFALLLAKKKTWAITSWSTYILVKVWLVIHLHGTE